MLKSASYLKTGTLFFHDRSYLRSGSELHTLLRELIEYPSDTVKSFRTWNFNYTGHELESGVIVFDKTKPSLLGLLFACRLNMKQERDFLYSRFNGDKETFFIAHELLEIPYYVTEHYAGMVGHEENGRLCGNIAHVSDDGELLWWNGGPLANKRSSNAMLKLDIYSVDKGTEPNTDYATSGGVTCIRILPGEVKAVRNDMRRLFEGYVADWQKISVNASDLKQAVESLNR